MKLMNDGYKRHGEVFTVPVLHKKFTFLLGPHVSGHFFKANDDEMSQKEVRQSAISHILHSQAPLDSTEAYACSRVACA